MEKKRVLCYGDSNTWGYHAETGMRYGADIRWPAVLQTMMGTNFQILEEGQCGRTIACEDPFGRQKNGMQYLLPCLETSAPFSYLTLMLGTNDLHAALGYSGEDLSRELRLMMGQIAAFISCDLMGSVPCLLIAPPPVGETIRTSPFGEEMGFERACRLSREFAPRWKTLATEFGWDFLDAGALCAVSESDAMHLTAQSHLALAGAVAAWLMKKELGR